MYTNLIMVCALQGYFIVYNGFWRHTNQGLHELAQTCLQYQLINYSTCSIAYMIHLHIGHKNKSYVYLLGRPGCKIHYPIYRLSHFLGYLVETFHQLRWILSEAYITDLLGGQLRCYIYYFQYFRKVITHVGRTGWVVSMNYLPILNHSFNQI